MVRKMTQEIYERWKRWSGRRLEDADLTKELRQLEPGTEEADREITDRFYTDLEFGTGGIRSIMGVGSNRMNIYTVAKATQGYVEYLKETGGKKVAIAYDNRIKSDLFARTAAEVFAAGGIRVCIFSELMPTPVLSFAIRQLHCDGGIVITASHNSSEYNGYKVYGSDGGQITNAVAGAITDKIQPVDLFDDVVRMEFEKAVEDGQIEYIDESVIQNYLESVSREAFDKDVSRALSIVYSPLNGTGLKCITSILQNNGFSDVTVVEEQRLPDGQFPTCRTPNPEKKEALSLGIEYAIQRNCDLVLATDPDCDRVGAAVKTSEGYRLLTGNETGVLLLDYVCKRRKMAGTMPDHPICMKTIVTTDLAVKIGKSYGVEIHDVLTGFKYIGEYIGHLENRQEADRFILGIEESYGYLSGAYVRDKDGVNASLLLCEMADFYKKQGQSLADVLDGIYKEFGYYVNTQYTHQFEGADGYEQMMKIMEDIRRKYQRSAEFLGDSLLKMYDYLAGYVLLPDRKKEKISLPKSNVCKLVWTDGSSIIIRPSGTEPKLKIYLAVQGNCRSTVEKREKEIAQKVKDYIACLIEE